MCLQPVRTVIRLECQHAMCVISLWGVSSACAVCGDKHLGFSETNIHQQLTAWSSGLCADLVCVCVCVCKRGREKEKSHVCVGVCTLTRTCVCVSKRENEERGRGLQDMKHLLLPILRMFVNPWGWWSLSTINHFIIIYHTLALAWTIRERFFPQLCDWNITNSVVLQWDRRTAVHIWDFQCAKLLTRLAGVQVSVLGEDGWDWRCWDH